MNQMSDQISPEARRFKKRISGGFFKIQTIRLSKTSGKSCFFLKTPLATPKWPWLYQKAQTIAALIQEINILAVDFWLKGGECAMLLGRYPAGVLDAFRIDWLGWLLLMLLIVVDDLVFPIDRVDEQIGLVFYVALFEPNRYAEVVLLHVLFGLLLATLFESVFEILGFLVATWIEPVGGRSVLPVRVCISRRLWLILLRWWYGRAGFFDVVRLQEPFFVIGEQIFPGRFASFGRALFRRKINQIDWTDENNG